MSENQKVMWGCGCYISSNSVNSSLLMWIDYYLKKLKDQIHSSHNRRSGEITSCMFETYKNIVLVNGHHIHKTATFMVMSIMLYFPSDKNDMHHWKYLLHCCEKCPIIVILGQKLTRNEKNSCPIISFHVYRVVLWCTVHGRRLYEETSTCQLFN